MSFPLSFQPQWLTTAAASIALAVPFPAALAAFTAVAGFKTAAYYAAPVALGLAQTALGYGFSRLKRKRNMSSQRSGRSMRRGSSRSRSASMGIGVPQHTSSGGAGHYQGKLRPPKKAKRPSKYDKAGYSQEVERYGKQALDNVCYIGATSYCKAELGTVIGIALIRSLLKRHYQAEYTHPDQFVVCDNGGSMAFGPAWIQFYYERAYANDIQPAILPGGDGLFRFYDSSVAGGNRKTLRQFGQWFTTNVLQAWWTGGSPITPGVPLTGADMYRLHGYQFADIDYTTFAADPGASPIDRPSTLFALRNQYFKCYSAVTLGIQNITPSDGTTADGIYYPPSLLTTHVDTNPIKGKLMKFKDMLPLLQQRMGAFGAVSNDNSYKLQIDPNNDGIIKPSASILADWTQIPTASMFANCTGEASVALEPGAIKDYSLIFKYDGTLENFIRGNRTVDGIGGITQQDVAPFAKGCFGTSCLFMLEKRMPTGNSAVNVNFHYEAKMGAVFGKRLGMLMQRGAAAATSVTDA